jgi:hypothetical protein
MMSAFGDQGETTGDSAKLQIRRLPVVWTLSQKHRPLQHTAETMI